jgi:hypothetical protein
MPGVFPVSGNEELERRGALQDMGNQRQENGGKGTEGTPGTGDAKAERGGEPTGFIPVHGGYADLHSYRKSVVIYDATVRFCEKFVDPYSRTRDQMVQAARSGKQNILEGSEPAPPPKRPRSNLPTSRAPVSRNCWRTTATSCVCGTSKNGHPTIPTPNV